MFAESSRFLNETSTRASCNLSTRSTLSPSLADSGESFPSFSVFSIVYLRPRSTVGASCKLPVDRRRCATPLDSARRRRHDCRPPSCPARTACSPCWTDRSTFSWITRRANTRAIITVFPRSSAAESCGSSHGSFASYNCSFTLRVTPRRRACSAQLAVCIFLENTTDLYVSATFPKHI